LPEAVAGISVGVQGRGHAIAKLAATLAPAHRLQAIAKCMNLHIFK